MFKVEIACKGSKKVVQSFECKSFKEAVSKKNNLEFQVSSEKYSVSIVEN